MSLARRLMLGGAFSGSALAAFTLTSAGDGGGWTSIGGPRAIYYGGRTYIGLDEQDGDVALRVFDNTAETVGASVVIHASLEATDLHDAPALLVREPDHKLVVAYSKHDGSTMYVRISTNSLDTDPTISGGFDTEQTLDATLGGTAYTYPQLVQVTEERNDPIFLFYRDHEDGLTTGILTYTKSTDGGETWASQTQLIKRSGFPIYWAISSTASRIDIGLSGGHPIEDADVSAYHLYYEARQFHTTDGTVIAASKPYALSDLTLVYDGTSDGSSGIGDVILDGEPTVVFGVWPGAGAFSLRYSRWDGAAWAESTITSGTDAGLYLTSAALRAGDVVYVCKPSGGVYELFRYVTPDGSSWTSTQITTGSANQGNFYPLRVQQGAGNLQMLMLFGAYTTYTSDSLGIKGVGY